MMTSDSTFAHNGSVKLPQTDNIVGAKCDRLISWWAFLFQLAPVEAFGYDYPLVCWNVSLVDCQVLGVRLVWS